MGILWHSGKLLVSTEFGKTALSVGVGEICLSESGYALGECSERVAIEMSRPPQIMSAGSLGMRP